MESSIVCSTMAAQCALDASVLWNAPFRPRVCGDRCFMVCGGSYDGVVLEGEESGRCVAGTLSGVGELRRRAKLHHLADEPMRHRYA